MAEFPEWQQDYPADPARPAHTRPTKPGIRLTRTGWIVTYILAVTLWTLAVLIGRALVMGGL
jgi:hypothetical protein